MASERFDLQGGSTCGKCGGSGYLPQYAYHDGGTCFACNGTGKGAYWTNKPRKFLQKYLTGVLDGLTKREMCELLYLYAHDAIIEIAKADETVSKFAELERETIPAHGEQPLKFITPEPQVVNARLAVIISGDWTAQKAWDVAQHQLELQLDRSSFDTYLRAAKLLDFEADCFTVRVHNAYARDMLQHRLYRNVARILRDVVGREVEVRFEADEQVAAPTLGLRRFVRTEN